MGHAVLSPSAASRWMACTPSARLEQQFPNTSSKYADEGTLAHAIGELLIRDMHNMIEPQDFLAQMEELKKSEYFSHTMFEYAEDYAHVVNEVCTGEFMLFVEQKLDMTSYIEDGFGTADAIVIRPDLRKLFFFDLKYGKGVRVDAADNSQLKIYGLGVLNDYGFVYDIEDIELTIYQPRISPVPSSWSTNYKELIEWAETVLKPAALLAYEGKGEYKAGKHCGFCRAKGTCRALAEHNMELAKLDFKNPDLLTDEEILDVLAKTPLFQSWLDAVGEHVFGTALGGKKWPGYKIVEGRSIRKYSSDEAVIAALKAKDLTDIYKAPALLGLGDMEKKIGKAPFAEIVGPLLIKPAGKPTLAVASDKRPEIVPGAQTDFEVEA